MSNKVQFTISAQDQASQKIGIVAKKLDAIGSKYAAFANKFAAPLKTAGLGNVVTSLDKVRTNFRNISESGGIQNMIPSAGILAGAKSIFDTSVANEKLAVSLSTIEGSSEKAKKSLEWVKTFAKETPYEMMEVSESFVQLKSYGLDPMADGLLKDIGNMASAMGKPLNQAVEAIADATTGEFERLKEFGIKASKQGAQVALTYNNGGKQITETVQNNAQSIQAAFQKISQVRFGGGMEAQSKTLGGAISNLSDNWEAFKLKLTEGGAFDTVKNSIEGLNKYFSENAEQVNKIAGVLGSLLIPAVLLAVGAMASFGFSILATSVSLNVQLLSSLARATFAFGAFVAKLVIVPAFGWVSSLAVGIQGLGFSAAKAWVMVLGPIVLVIAAIAAVGYAVYYLYNNWDSVVARIKSLWDSLKKKVSEIIVIIKNVSSEFMSVMSGIGSSIFSFLIAPIDLAVAGINKLISAFNSLTNMSIPSIPSFSGVMKGAVTGNIDVNVAGQPAQVTAGGGGGVALTVNRGSMR